MKLGGRWVLAVPAAAALVGCVLLSWFLPAHPAAQCDIRVDREQSIVRAREVSAAFGFDTVGWTAVVMGDTHNTAARFAADHPRDSAARRFSPAYPKIAFANPGKPERIIVELSAAGDVNRWQRRGFAQRAASDPVAARGIAENALARMMGTDRNAFHIVTDAERSKDAFTFAWEHPGTLSERFEVSVDGTGVLRAELKPVFPADTFEALKRVRNWFDIASIALDWIGGTAAAVIVFLYWAVRRGIKYRFVFSLVGLVALWAVVTWLNYHRSSQLYDSLVSSDSTSIWIQAPLLLVLLSAFFFVLCAAMDAVGDGARLATLRSAFTSSLLNRRLGRSVLSGLLWGPLAAAVPLWIFSWHLRGSKSTGDLDAGLFYSEYPALQAVNIVISPAVIGLFGFVAGLFGRYLRPRALRETLLFALGLLLFIIIGVPSDTFPIAFLLSGSLLYAIYYFVYRSADLVAALSTAWCAAVVWNAGALLLQPARSLHVSGIEALVFLAIVTLSSVLVAWRGRELQIAIVEPALAASQREKLMAEFSIAHRVQQQMLPDQPPEIPGCSVAASCHPASEVGGDLFDFLPLPDGRWTITVGDVSGKGVPAALYMTLTKGLLIATTQDNDDLLDIITHVNGHIHAATERRTFVTMALGAFDPETRTFDHVRAGHNPIVWRRPSQRSTSLLNAPGIGLGIVPDRIFRRATRPERLQLGEGDALVFYSDGVTEAMNHQYEQFGEERLMKAVEETDGWDAATSREYILHEVRSFLNGSAAQDDMTLVVLRVN